MQDPSTGNYIFTETVQKLIMGCKYSLRRNFIPLKNRTSFPAGECSSDVTYVRMVWLALTKAIILLIMLWNYYHARSQWTTRVVLCDTTKEDRSMPEEQLCLRITTGCRHKLTFYLDILLVHTYVIIRSVTAILIFFPCINLRYYNLRNNIACPPLV
jgi:hypothetical protein